MNFSTLINQQKWIYFTEIVEPEDNTLRLVIEEARPGEHAWEIVFNSYVAYCVRNESFTLQDSSEEFVGRVFCIYSQSHFLDYLRVATFARDDYPGPFTHYGINALNHIVDVVSVAEPSVNVLRSPQPPVS